MFPFDDIGSALGGKLKELVASAFESAMQAVWDASLWILREAFRLADQFSMFTVDTHSGPISVLWPMMLWVAGVLGLGLFFWQLTMTSLRGGRGFMRLVGGPVQYGIALAVTVGLVACFLAAADGLTDGILRYGLQSKNFQEALTHTTFADGAVDGVKAVVLGICAFMGIIPAAIGYVLEMLFREAAIYVLVATIPISAAGLLANVSKSWFWKAVRWILACIAMKPVLALTLVLGVAIAGGAKGLSGLLAGVAVLIVSVFVPFVLFRLFAFVDPSSDAGSAFRNAMSSAGIDSYGAGNPAMQLATGGAGPDGSGGGGSDQESANTGRFDDAAADYAGEEMDNNGVGHPSGETGGGGAPSSDSPEGSDSAAGDDPGEDGGSGGMQTPAANRGQITASDGIGPQGVDGDTGGGDSSDGSGGDPPPPEPPAPSGNGPSGNGGGGGPTSGGGGAAASGEAAEAAVIV